MLEVELRIPDLRLRIVDGRLRGAKVSGSLIDVFRGPRMPALKVLRPNELAVA
jgi:hypothetical protein